MSSQKNPRMRWLLFKQRSTNSRKNCNIPRPRSNARQRGSEIELKMKFGAAGLASKIIPAIDALEKALDNENDETQAFANGVKMTLNSLKNALESEGITIIEATGQVFDPTQMEAIATVPAGEEQEAGLVLEELESGYMLHDRVLRPAKVIVISE